MLLSGTLTLFFGLSRAFVALSLAELLAARLAATVVVAVLIVLRPVDEHHGDRG